MKQLMLVLALAVVVGLVAAPALAVAQNSPRKYDEQGRVVIASPAPTPTSSKRMFLDPCSMQLARHTDPNLNSACRLIEERRLKVVEKTAPTPSPTPEVEQAHGWMRYDPALHSTPTCPPCPTPAPAPTAPSRFWPMVVFLIFAMASLAVTYSNHSQHHLIRPSFYVELISWFLLFIPGFLATLDWVF